MTTIREVREACLVCGTEGTWPTLGSSNTLAAPDLDTRPAEMLRSTMGLWVRRCPGCGYCAPSLANGPADAARTVRSEPYARQWADATLPELARKFQCWSMVLEAAGEFAGAGWSSVHSAWACDDASRPPGARGSRLRAVDLFGWARSAGQTFAPQTGAEEALLADLLRRAGDVEQAAEFCRAGLAREPEPLLRSILELELRLIAEGDRGRHTVAEAQG